MRSSTALLALVLLLPSTVRAQDSPGPAIATAAPKAGVPEGILTIYPRETQLGIAANRIFRDGNGRITRTIYYRANGKADPIREEDLVPEQVVNSHYDAMGRVRREEYCSPGMVRQWTWDFVYSKDEEVRVKRSAEGLRTYEIRRRSGTEKSHLYFDHTGERLVGIRGEVPSDLSYAWGETSDGLACGIGVSRSKGPLEDIYVTVTIRNSTGEATQVVTLWPYRVLEVELRDDQGNIVPEDHSKLSAEDERMSRLNPSATENRQTLAPYVAATYEGFKLDDWYSDLPSGAYRLTVRRRAGGKGFELVSKPLALEILR